MAPLLLLVLLLGLGGCASTGYTTRELFPEDVRTVAVPIFDNRTFERGIEFELSEALTKQVQSRTPYRVVGPGTADTMLQGTITSVDRQTLSRVRDGGLPQDVQWTVRIDFTWQDLRTGKVIRQRQGFEAVGRHVPTRPVGERAGIAQSTAVQSLAHDMVDVMRADW